MDISTDLLRTFVAVCELRSFSGAAKKRHRSQAAASIQIATLEDRVGLKFFDRSERPLKITESGQIFLNFACEFLNKIEEVERLLKELSSGSIGQLKIGASTSIGAYLLPKLILEILGDFPKLKITMSVEMRRQIYDAVRRADLDFGITLADKPPEGLVGRALKREPLCFVVSPEHPLSKKKKVTLEMVQSTPFVVGTPGNEWTDMVDRLLQKNGLQEYPISLRVSNYHATKEAVRAGLGVAVMPQFTILPDIRNKNVYSLDVKNIRLYATIMLIERSRPLYSPTLLAVKSFLEKRIGGHHF